MFKSRTSATNLLKRVYKNNDSDTLTTVDMFAVLGKKPNKPNDAAYIATQVSLLKSYDLITPNYSSDKGYRRRESITLTEEGRAAIGRAGATSPSGLVNIKPYEPPAPIKRVVTPESVLAEVKILREQNPSFNVKLIFEPKEQSMSR